MSPKILFVCANTHTSQVWILSQTIDLFKATEDRIVMWSIPFERIYKGIKQLRPANASKKIRSFTFISMNDNLIGRPLHTDKPSMLFTNKLQLPFSAKPKPIDYQKRDITLTNECLENTNTI